MITTKRDYWGPLLWESLNIIVREYPINPTAEDRQNFKMYVMSLGDVLPCRDCRAHFKKHLRSISLDAGLRSRDSLVDFVIDLHNAVNRNNGKSVLERSVARKIVLGQQNPLDKMGYYLLGFAIACGVAYVISRRKKK